MILLVVITQQDILNAVLVAILLSILVRAISSNGPATYTRADDAISLYATGDTSTGYAGKLYGVSISKAFGAEVAKVNGV